MMRRGIDERPDPMGRDKYPYPSGHFHPLLTAVIHRNPSKAVFIFCRAIMKANLPHLTPANRFVHRRISCAYGWLDENQHQIPENVVGEYLAQLQASE
jgi:hypothetical protein